MFSRWIAAAFAAVFLLSACAHRAPKPYGKPFPINAKQVSDSRYSAVPAYGAAHKAQSYASS